jgi:chromosome segregation protein
MSIVTTKGEVMHVDGWLTGGDSKEGGQQGLLAYERELRELPRQLDEHKALIDQLHSQMSAIQRAQEGRRAEQTTLDKSLQKILNRINELNKAVTSSQREQERLQTEIKLAASVEQQLAAEVAGLQQEVQAAQERVRAHEKSQREMTGLVEEFQHEMEERAIVYRRQQDELGKARTALAVKRQEAKSLRQQLESQRAQARDLKVQVGQQVARLQEHEKQRQTLQEAIALHRTTLQQAQARSHTLANDLHGLEENLSAIDQRIAVVEQQRVQMQQAKTEQESLYRRVLLDSQKARDALETLLTQLQEEMGITDPEELSNRAVSAQAVAGDEANTHTNPSSDDHMQTGGNRELSEEEEALLKRLRRRIDNLRSRLKAMGGCDVNAPQIYEETRTRYEFLSTQINDMDQAAMHLRSIIGQLDVTMARQFEATFQAVNARFREHFTTLFNGGNARLELMTAKSDNDDSPAPASMPAGIEVIVQPPGKKVQDLSLLSGGERALVSAALLFSLLEINPPPFCLLDEVDAALDESNVTRFCDILKRLAQRTQFIVITHNRVTMTAAQVIYGVSMKDSVSRLLSMRLEEATATAVG